MKKIYLGMIVVFALILMGCGTTAIQHKHDQSGNPSVIPTLAPTTIPTPAPTTIPTPAPITTPTTGQNVVTPNTITYYNDENHKIINFGKLSIELHIFHIVSETFNGNDYIIEYKEDQSFAKNDCPVESMIIREIKNLKLMDKESIKTYLIKMMPSYENIRIFNKITNDSGIMNLAVISGGGKSYCIVNYGDTSYIIDSVLNSNSIEGIILTTHHNIANYEEIKQNVECANSFSASIYEVIDYETETVKYEITQGKNGKKYYAELNLADDGDSRYYFILKDDNDKVILNITSAAGEPDKAIEFIDYNMDGYAGIQVVDLIGARNSLCNIYVWDESVNNFILEESGIEVTY